MVRVELENLTKYFGRVRAVEDVNLDIGHGELVALLGPSGCGKTTTLLMVAGIYRPTRGRILFDGEDVTDLPPRERNIGMVFQSYALYPHMTVYDNIAFPLKIKKAPKAETDRKVREVCEMLKIEELLARRPAQLSGGQQQRVALARALVKEPDVLLLDEPLSNLDALLRVQMRAEIKRLQKELSITTIYVTHDQVEALSLADRVVVMNRGRVQQIGAPEEIYGKPANTFVAGFIGTPPMNLIECEFVEGADGTAVITRPGVRYPLGRKLAEHVKSSISTSKVILGIRPEHVELTDRERAHAIARVLVVEPLGKDVVVTVSVGNDQTVKITVPPTTQLQPDQEVFLRFTRKNLRLFDGKTGEAVV